MAILRIELLEDCDLNSGRVLNTYFAEDVFYDSFGLPYIPAWIIRNSLIRAMKNSDIMLSEQELAVLTEEKDSFILDDALIADRESMRQAIVSDQYDSVLMQNPQIILGAGGFTKVKAVSGSNGDAYIRMLAKGTIFEAYFELPDRCRRSFRRVMEQARGLYVGHEVRARFTIDESWERPVYLASEPAVDFTGDSCRLEYDLHVISRIVTTDHVSGNLDTHSYVTGAEIRDALRKRAELADIFADSSRVRCSFAYIAVSGRRGLPIPASYSTKKQDKNDLRDLCSLGRRKDDYDQIKGMGTLYIDDPDGSDVYAVSVRMEQGILQRDNDGEFRYDPYTAIAEGQTLKGMLEGPAEDIRRIYESLEKNGYVRTGELPDFGFGNTYMEVRSVKPLKAHEPVFTDEIAVLLASPARLYRDGYYEASAANVAAEIQRRLGNDAELEIVRSSQKTTFIANYNQAWGELEPLEYAVASGSVYRMRARDGRSFDISALLGGIFLGGHHDTGYGEAWVLPAKNLYYRTIRYGEFQERDFPLSYKVDPNPGRRLMRKLYQMNANAVAAYMGSSQAGEFIREGFRTGPLDSIRSAMNDDFDLEEVFGAYMDSLKEAGLNVIRRNHHESFQRNV